MEDKDKLVLKCCVTKNPKIVAAESSRHQDLEKVLKDHMENPCNLQLQYLLDITSNFSEERELGRGAFGVVYKGVLQNGEVVAVKKLVFLPGMQDKHFENEVYHLSRLKHRNIVRILGYCYDIQHILIEHNRKYLFAEMPQRLLCLEFLPKGSLEKHISDGSHGLDWHKRYNILVGICHGLHYLHEEWQTGTPIIHLDLKPANILLNENMEPKIVDFGLSRLFDPEQTRAYTRTLVGSLGYMAPEYLNKGIITIKADIFSLGVIVLEIITGHKNYPDGTGISTQDFVEHVLKSWRNRFKEHTSIEKNCEQIKRCIELGLQCVQTDASKRPTTREIIESLERCASTILHVRNEEKSVTPDKVDDQFWKNFCSKKKFWKKSGPTSDHRKEVQISKRLKKHGDYIGLTEEGQPSPCNRGFGIEILEQPERRDLKPGEAFVSLATEGDSLRGRLLYLENRVALARILFPMEARQAMEISQVDGTLEFTLGSRENLHEIPRKTFDLNDTPFKMNEGHLARIRVLSKTVELGKRFFPSCSKVLDSIMDDEVELASLERETSIDKRKRFHDIQDALQKAFSEDREEFDKQARLFSSSSATIRAI